MDDLVKKIEELYKSLLSLKQPAKQDFFVPALKPPALKKPSLKPPSNKPNAIPGGLPPPSKKDPKKVAEQLKNPRPGKVQVDVLKIENNGQWSLTKAEGTKVSGIPNPQRVARVGALRAPINAETESFANHHSPEQNRLIHGLDFHNSQPMRGSVAGGAHLAHNPTTSGSVILKRAGDHANQMERGHLENGFNSAKREVLFHNMARDYFGMGKHVPTTAGFTRNGEDYSAQHKLDSVSHPDLKEHEIDLESDTKPKDEFLNPNHGKILDKLHQSGDLHKLALMDHLMGHHDRHSGNYMLDDKNLHLVDNGTAFDYKNFDTKHYPGYLERTDEVMGKDNSQLHPAAAKWLNSLEPEKAKAFFAKHGHDESSPATQGFLRRLQGLKNAVNNGPEHYGNMNKLLDKNRLTSGPLYQHPSKEHQW